MRLTILTALIILLTLSGCALLKVEGPGPDSAIDLSGRWNDSDSRLLASELSADILARAWLQDFWIIRKRSPVIMMGPLRNESSEALSMDLFVKDLIRELLNSGQVRFVAAREDSETSLQPQFNAAEDSSQRIALETGADFLLMGSISSLVDRVDGKQVKWFHVSMQIVDVESSKTVWSEKKSIQKPLANLTTRLRLPRLTLNA